ncbi:MAG: hypothetical protein AAFV45_11650 [Pseudomonadota bacterium]
MTGKASTKTIYRHHSATWMYRLLPITIFGVPALFSGGVVSPPVATTAFVLAVAAAIYAKIKLHGRIDIIETRDTEDRIRVRKPGLVLSTWQTLPREAFKDAVLKSTNVRNAASAYVIAFKINDGRDTLKIPLNGAAVNLDALAVIAPDPVAKFREATQNTRIHYDL